MKFTKTLAMLLVLAMALTMTAFAEDAIKVGFIGPLTGPAASYGNSAKQGAEIAISAINAMGGTQFVLDAQDDEHDAEKSVNAYNTLLDNGTQMIIGCVTTTPCLEVGSHAVEDRVFMLTPSASNPAVVEGRDNVYQICFTDPNQGIASAQYIAQNGLAAKVAVIYNNADSYSTGIYQTFESEAAAQGLEIVDVETFTDDTTDFSVQVAGCKDAGAELVFLPIYYTPASMIFQQAASMEYAPIFFGVDGMDGILNIEGFDTALAEGVYMLTPFSADATDDATVAFVTAYVEAYGVTPDQFAADGYDAAFVFAKAVEAAGITPETSVEDACEMLISVMGDLTIDGVTGTMVWDAEGKVSKSPKAVRIENGAYVGA